MAGASLDDNLPTTTLLLDDDEDVLHDEVGRNATPPAALTAASTNAVQWTIPMRSTVRTGMAPTLARYVQFQEMDTASQQLMHKLWALQFGVPITETAQPEAIEANKTAEPVKSLNLAFNHAMELLCFMTEISLDPGLPETLREALGTRDMEEWKEALTNEILNFLEHEAWRRVPMSQVLSEGQKAIPMKPVFKIKDEQDGSEQYKARIVMKGFLMIPGVNYTESFSPVTMEVGVQCIIGISLYFINEDIEQNVPAE